VGRACAFIILVLYGYNDIYARHDTTFVTTDSAGGGSVERVFSERFPGCFASDIINSYYLCYNNNRKYDIMYVIAHAINRFGYKNKKKYCFRTILLCRISLLLLST